VYPEKTTDLPSVPDVYPEKTTDLPSVPDVRSVVFFGYTSGTLGRSEVFSG
jgi:hypothetical protein